MMPECKNTNYGGRCRSCGAFSHMILLVVWPDGFDYLCWDCWDWLCLLIE